MDTVLTQWRRSLAVLDEVYRTRRPAMRVFFPALFVFFVVINDACYWLAMVSAFPGLVFGPTFFYYFKVQVPVALLGALFDSLSFFVTVYLIQRALRTESGARFVGHLSVDLVIAILATAWVLFVFSFSSWLIRYLDPAIVDVALGDRQAVYGDRALSAVQHPTENLRNIYFGLLMGVSAMLPTCVHVGMALRSMFLVRLRPA